LQIVADAIFEILFEDFAGCQIEFRVPNDATADKDPQAFTFIEKFFDSLTLLLAEFDPAMVGVQVIHERGKAG